MATILARTVAALVAAEVAPADIHIVRATAEPADVLGEIPEAIRREVVSAVHDPSSRQALSYLAATADARPIYVNRAIHDADLVVSIGVLRLDDAPGYHGTNAGVFPTFSDAATIARYRSSKSDEARRRRRLDRQSDEAAWLLGAQFTIEVVPGAGDEVLHVLAGDSAAVSRQGASCAKRPGGIRLRGRRAWWWPRSKATRQRRRGTTRAGRWLRPAAPLAPGGAIALCTQLAAAPGPALQRLVGGGGSPRGRAHDIDRGHPADALVARQLADALDQGSIYLVSRLEAELVEELGLVPLAADDVSRLARRFDSCLVLANAHHAIALPAAGAARRRSRAAPRSPK